MSWKMRYLLLIPIGFVSVMIGIGAGWLIRNQTVPVPLEERAISITDEKYLSKYLTAQLEEVENDSRFRFRILTNPEFKISEDGKTETGNIYLENPEENLYQMQAQIKLSEDSSLIYTSPVLKPGEHLDTVELERILSPGLYRAEVSFQALESDTVVGGATMEISITVTK